MIPMRENILYFEKDSVMENNYVDELLSIVIFRMDFISQKDEDWYEISHSSIREMGREIGKGAFGRVFIARISDIPGKLNSQIVAIKKLKSK